MTLDDLEVIRSEALPELLMHAVVMHCRVKEKRVVYSIPLYVVFRVIVVSLLKTTQLKPKRWTMKGIKNFDMIYSKSVL